MAGKKKTSKDRPTALRLKITIAESLPEISREIVVSSTTTLEELHWIIQTIMPWQDSHPHSFTDREGKLYARANSIVQNARDESKVLLDELLDVPRAKITYQYDFTDSWDHLVELLKRVPAEPGKPLPRCEAGKRAGPPEGCGGIWGYAELLAAVKDARHSLHQTMVEFAGANFDPIAFDLAKVNRNLRALKF